MKKYYFLFLLCFSSIFMAAQNVGIGTTSPNVAALLHVDLGTSQTKGLLVTGTFNSASTVPNMAAGSRMMFFPGTAAFRAGFAGTQWDDNNVGLFSVAMGQNTTASAIYATALGRGSIASQTAAMAMGSNTVASEFASTAMGNQTTASGFASTSMGHLSTASGFYSTAIGRNTTASGETSTAMGYFATASGDFSTSMGYNTTASGVLSFAAGTNISTNNKRGAFFFGDGDPNQKGIRSIGFADQFAARFNGGYYFISSDAGADIGVQVLAGGNAWITMSSAHLKENLLPVNGEAFLQKISGLHLASWNYKTQDPKTFRHYGPMAQEFYAAFGKDQYGFIGNDTTINQSDFDGVNLIAIQALEKRTAQQSKEMAELKRENNELKIRLEKLEKRISGHQ